MWELVTCIKEGEWKTTGILINRRQAEQTKSLLYITLFGLWFSSRTTEENVVERDVYK